MYCVSCKLLAIARLVADNLHPVANPAFDADGKLFVTYSGSRGEKVPDAFLLNREGQPINVIEFGGSYDADRLQAFHNDCLDRALAYEIW